jgi:hypothetical protein
MWNAVPSGAVLPALLLWVIFSLLYPDWIRDSIRSVDPDPIRDSIRSVDPDPDPYLESGSTDLIEFGSNPDPDLKP